MSRLRRRMSGRRLQIRLWRANGGCLTHGQEDTRPPGAPQYPPPPLPRNEDAKVEAEKKAKAEEEEARKKEEEEARIEAEKKAKAEEEKARAEQRVQAKAAEQRELAQHIESIFDAVKLKKEPGDEGDEPTPRKLDFDGAASPERLKRSMTGISASGSEVRDVLNRANTSSDLATPAATSKGKECSRSRSLRRDGARKRSSSSQGSGSGRGKQKKRIRTVAQKAARAKRMKFYRSLESPRLRLGQNDVTFVLSAEARDRRWRSDRPTSLPRTAPCLHLQLGFVLFLLPRPAED